jgi:uncharacterized protein YceK
MRRFRLAAVVLVALATGCASARTPGGKTSSATVSRASGAIASKTSVDVSGAWSGRWVGHGILDIPREEPAEVQLIQRGAAGSGRLVLEGTSAAESVPLPIRRAGITGSRIHFEVSGATVVMRHEPGGEPFALVLEVDGDRMVGHLRDTATPVRLELARVR